MIDYRAYASASTSHETASVNDHQHAIHLLACNVAKCSPIKKFFFTSRLSNKFVKNMAIKNFTITQMCSYTTLLFIVNHDISLRMSLVFGH